MSSPAVRCDIPPIRASSTLSPPSPGSELVEMLASHVATLAGDGASPVDAIGIAVPGVVRHGVVEESPNLSQLKGTRLSEQLSKVLSGKGITAPVYVGNDADAIAAGVCRHPRPA